MKGKDDNYRATKNERFVRSNARQKTKNSFKSINRKRLIYKYLKKRSEFLYNLGIIKPS